MNWTPPRAASHLLVFLLVLVLLSALAICLGLGPVVRSATDPLSQLGA